MGCHSWLGPRKSGSPPGKRSRDGYRSCLGLREEIPAGRSENG